MSQQDVSGSESIAADSASASGHQQSPARPAPGPRRGRALARWSVERFALVGSWVVVIVIFGALRPAAFLTWQNFGIMFGGQAVLVVLTIGLLLILRAGEFDLSVASVLTMSSMMLGVYNGLDHLQIGLAIVACLAMGALTGFINGLFVSVFGIDSFIVTLGTGTVLQGIILWISGSQTYSNISPGLVRLVVGVKVIQIPLEFFYGLALTIVVWVVFQYLPIGRRMLFVGRSREVARLSGIRVNRIRWGSFVATGAIAAFAGILYAGTTGGADPTSGLSYLLPAFAAAFLGATAIQPGTFNPWGSLIGAYFLATGILGLSIMGISTFVQDLFYGGVLLIAVAGSQLVRKREAMKIA